MKRLVRRSSIAIGLVSFALLLTVSGQSRPFAESSISRIKAPKHTRASNSLIQSSEFWQKKDYHQWSETECNRLLGDSPWALKFSLTDRGTPALNTAGNGTFGDLYYQIQFRSALPVRQAMVRLAQLKKGYDKMPSDQKKSFDEQANKILSGSYEDSIVLHVDCFSNLRNDNRDLGIFWKNQKTEALQDKIYLVNQRGNKQPVMQYVAGNSDGHEFYFNFAKQQDGKPFIQPDDKTVTLEFVHPSIAGKGSLPVRIDFKPDKMIISGSLAY